MDKVVFDACSLIYITKISIKELILNSFSNIMIPNNVEKEVLYDSDKYSEVTIIKKNLESEKIIRKLTKAKRFTKNLGLGEAEAVTLARKEQALLITDDKLPLNIALNWGIQVKTTETLLILLLKMKIMNFQQFHEKINELNKIKTLKPEIFQFLMKEAEKYK